MQETHCLLHRKVSSSCRDPPDLIEQELVARNVETRSGSDSVAQELGHAAVAWAGRSILGRPGRRRSPRQTGPSGATPPSRTGITRGESTPQDGMTPADVAGRRLGSVAPTRRGDEAVGALRGNRFSSPRQNAVPDVPRAKAEDPGAGGTGSVSVPPLAGGPHRPHPPVGRSGPRPKIPPDAREPYTTRVWSRSGRCDSRRRHVRGGLRNPAGVTRRPDSVVMKSGGQKEGKVGPSPATQSVYNRNVESPRLPGFSRDFYATSPLPRPDPNVPELVAADGSASPRSTATSAAPPESCRPSHRTTAPGGNSQTSPSGTGPSRRNKPGPTGSAATGRQTAVPSPSRATHTSPIRPSTATRPGLAIGPRPPPAGPCSPGGRSPPAASGAGRAGSTTPAPPPDPRW